MNADPNAIASGPPAWGFGRWALFALIAAAPAAIALPTLYLLGSLDPADLEFNESVAGPLRRAFQFVRWGTVGATVLGLIALIASRRTRRAVIRHHQAILDVLVVMALIAIGAVYGLADWAFAVSTMGVPTLVILIVGMIAAWPMLLGRGRGVRRLLVVVAVFAAFAGWIVGVRQIDWNPRKPFLRAHAQIRPGMTRGQVEALMSKEFRGRPPFSRWDASGGQYTLDPNDGRYNSEFLVISMSEGRVVSTQYLPD